MCIRDSPGDDAGSFHGSDLWFMFDSLGNSWRPFEGKHYDLARQVTSYWTNFVKYKDPNGTDYNGNPLPLWEPYSRDKKAVMKFLDAPAFTNFTLLTPSAFAFLQHNILLKLEYSFPHRSRPTISTFGFLLTTASRNASVS